MSKILYKYLDIKGGKMMIGNQTLQFTNPTKMNDPFDCNPNLLDYSDIPESMRGWMPKEWIQEMKENDAINKRNDAWICCLSKVYDALLMWSHYCGNHSGICVGLNLDKVIQCVPQLFDSHFCEPLILEVRYQDISQKPDFKKVSWTYQLETKDKQWEYEQEVRLVFPQATHFYAEFPPSAKSNDVKELREYLPLRGDCFEEIYFGKDIDENVKEKIIKHARKKLNPDIKLYQMQVDEDAFHLNAEEINY